MSSYIDAPIETDPDVLAEEAFGVIQTAFPNWAPADGNLETVMVEAFARMNAEARDVASAVPMSIFRTFGRSVIGFPSVDATAATVSTTWTAKDIAGYTIPFGTVVGIRSAAGQIVPFQTIQTTVIPAGSSSVAGVIVQALQTGAAGSGLGSIGGAVQLVNILDFITGITQATVTTGGIDAETDLQYLGRLARRMSLLAERPILATDFAAMTQENFPTVERALGIDGYNPAGGTYGNEKYVAVVAVDVSGEDMDAPTKSAIDAYLQARRELNFIVNVIAPTYTTVDVTFTVKALAGYDLVDLDARTEQAVRDFLSPANWGYRRDVGGPQVVNTWVQTTVVRLNEVISLLDRVEGVDYVVSVTMRVSPAAYAAADISITGAAPLTRAGVIAGTVT